MSMNNNLRTLKCPRCSTEKHLLEADLAKMKCILSGEALIINCSNCHRTYGARIDGHLAYNKFQPFHGAGQGGPEAAAARARVMSERNYH